MSNPKASPTIPVAHRSAITAADVLAVPGTVTTSLQSGGSLATSAMNNKVVAGNTYGRTTATAGTQRTPAGGTLTIRMALAAVTGATFYDIYLSTDADPKFVGRITEAQRAAGCIISAQNTVGGGGTPGAVDVQVAGTGLQSSSTAAQNTAYSLPTPVACDQYQYIDFDIAMTVTPDNTVSPSLAIIPFFYNPRTQTYFAGAVQTLSFGGFSNVYQPMTQRMRIECRGCPNVALVIASIAGTGASVNVDSCLS